MRDQTHISSIEIPSVGLAIPEGITAVIGSGGKTSFLRYLASVLPGPVILATSTHMRPFDEIPLLLTPQESAAHCKEDIQEHENRIAEIPASGDNETESLTQGNNEAEILNCRNSEAEIPADRNSEAEILDRVQESLAENRLLCIGTPMYNKDRTVITKLSAPTISFQSLLPYARYILVEADGSRNRPLKAHRPFEPVIPRGTSLTVCIVGASGLGRPVSEAVHCPEIFCRLTGANPQGCAAATAVAAALNKENLADHYVINQADAVQDPEELQKLRSLIRKPVSVISLKELAAQTVEKR